MTRQPDSISRKSFPVWATILTMVGVVILCGLGTWQLYRLQWKTDLLAQLDALYAQPPREGYGAFTDVAVHQNAPGPFFGRVTLEGRLLAGQSMLVGPRTYEGRHGYHLITPLQMDDDTVVMVNRGFVIGPVEEAESRKAMTGLLRRPEAPNMFVPANQPQSGTWFSIAPAAMSAAHNLPASRALVLYAESENPPAPAAVIAQEARPVLRNNHRDYAGFWFAMAGVLIAIYLIRFILPRFRRQDK